MKKLELQHDEETVNHLFLFDVRVMSTDSEDRDIEEGEEGEEGDEKVDNEKRMKEEEEQKKAKERQAFLENIYVMICMLIIVAMAVVIVILKINLFSEEPNITSIPLDQQVGVLATVDNNMPT